MGVKRLPPRFSRTAMNLRHTFFNWTHWCCSARASVVATVSAVIPSHNFASHNNLSRSKPYLSAAANKCCIIIVDVHIETDPVNSWTSGSSSEYMKISMACSKEREGLKLEIESKISSVLSSIYCTRTSKTLFQNNTKDFSCAKQQIPKCPWFVK